MTQYECKSKYYLLFVDYSQIIYLYSNVKLYTLEVLFSLM